MRIVRSIVAVAAAMAMMLAVAAGPASAHFNQAAGKVVGPPNQQHIEDAVVVPGVTVGFTDSRVFRNRDVIAYGFSGGVNEPALMATFHGHNERVTIESFGLYCHMVFEVTHRLVT
jgi:acetylornithine deacetylase/succinyl-diaminopimelate desuccinylase-like protein